MLLLDPKSDPKYKTVIKNYKKLAKLIHPDKFLAKDTTNIMQNLVIARDSLLASIEMKELHGKKAEVKTLDEDETHDCEEFELGIAFLTKQFNEMKRKIQQKKFQLPTTTGTWKNFPSTHGVQNESYDEQLNRSTNAGTSGSRAFGHGTSAETMFNCSMNGERNADFISADNGNDEEVEDRSEGNDASSAYYANINFDANSNSFSGQNIRFNSFHPQSSNPCPGASGDDPLSFSTNNENRAHKDGFLLGIELRAILDHTTRRNTLKFKVEPKNYNDFHFWTDLDHVLKHKRLLKTYLEMLAIIKGRRLKHLLINYPNIIHCFGDVEESL